MDECDLWIVSRSAGNHSSIEISEKKIKRLKDNPYQNATHLIRNAFKFHLKVAW